MKKSIYSLVLHDEVVARLDRMAARRGLSRSALADEVLAQHVAFVTQSARLSALAVAIAASLDRDGNLSFALHELGGALELCASLGVKYSPTVKYMIIPDGEAYTLTVTLRTQSRKLARDITRFFELWTHIERAYGRASGGEWHSCAMTRTLELTHDAGGDEVRQAETILGYICAADKAMRAYFSSLGDMQAAVRLMEAALLDYLRQDSEKRTL